MCRGGGRQIRKTQAERRAVFSCKGWMDFMWLALLSKSTSEEKGTLRHPLHDPFSHLQSWSCACRDNFCISPNSLSNMSY